MQRPKNLKAGDQFRVIEGNSNFHPGEIVTLEDDDGTDIPSFWKEDEFDHYSIHFSRLEPYKTVRDVQVQISNRVKELMIKQCLDTSNGRLAMDITIIYVQAQSDLRVQQQDV